MWMLLEQHTTIQQVCWKSPNHNFRKWKFWNSSSDRSGLPCVPMVKSGPSLATLYLVARQMYTIWSSQRSVYYVRWSAKTNKSTLRAQGAPSNGYIEFGEAFFQRYYVNVDVCQPSFFSTLICSSIYDNSGVISAWELQKQSTQTRNWIANELGIISNRNPRDLPITNWFCNYVSVNTMSFCIEMNFVWQQTVLIWN